MDLKNLTKEIFDLRKQAKELTGKSKEDKLSIALENASRLYKTEPSDEWVQKAFAWVLIDLCNHCIATSKLNQANNQFQKLLSINFNPVDDIIEKQKSILRPKVDQIYSEIKKAEEYSKNGKHKDAINIFSELIKKNKLTDLHHDSYGWVIYRYLKELSKELSIVQVKTFLKNYLDLKTERPSLLHSMIINFALAYAKEHSDFDLYNFFKLWGPENLRSEDKRNQLVEDKEYPSLISRILREFVEKDIPYDINYLIEHIQLDEYSFFDDGLPF